MCADQSGGFMCSRTHRFIFCAVPTNLQSTVVSTARLLNFVSKIQLKAYRTHGYSPISADPSQLLATVKYGKHRHMSIRHTWSSSRITSERVRYQLSNKLSSHTLVLLWLYLPVNPDQPVVRRVRFFQVLQLDILVANLHIPCAIISTGLSVCLKIQHKTSKTNR